MTHFRGGGRQPAHSRALAPAAPRARSPTRSAAHSGGRRAAARSPRPSRGWQRLERCRGRTPPQPSPPAAWSAPRSRRHFSMNHSPALLALCWASGAAGNPLFSGGPLSPDVRSPSRTGYQHQPAALHCLLWGGFFGGRGCCCSQGCWGGGCQGSERRMAGAPRRAGAEGEALRERLWLMRADRSRSKPLPGLPAAGLSRGVPGVGTGWGTGGSQSGSGRFGVGFVAPCRPLPGPSSWGIALGADGPRWKGGGQGEANPK